MFHIKYTHPRTGNTFWFHNFKNGMPIGRRLQNRRFSVPFVSFIDAWRIRNILVDLGFIRCYVCYFPDPKFR